MHYGRHCYVQHSPKTDPTTSVAAFGGDLVRVLVASSLSVIVFSGLWLAGMAAGSGMYHQRALDRVSLLFYLNGDLF